MVEKPVVAAGNGTQTIYGALIIAYRFVWLLLFATAVASLTYYDPRDEGRLIRRAALAHAVGFALYVNSGADGLSGGPYGAEGRRLGYRDSDVLLTINGQRMASGINDQIAALSGLPGSIAILNLRHADGTRFTVRVARDPGIEARAYAGTGIGFAEQRWATFAIGTLATAATLAAAALLFFRRPRDPIAQLLGAALVLDSSEIFTRLPGIPEIAARIGSSAAGLMVLLAILMFPNGRFATRWHVAALAAGVALDVTNLVEWTTSGFSLWSIPSTAACLLLTLIAVARQLRLTPAGVRRQQVKFVLFGFAAYCLLTLVAELTAPFELMRVSAGTQAWITFAKRLIWEMGDVALPAGLLIALLRYRLYDAETAISRSVAYGALTVSLVAVFAGSEKIIEVIGEGYVGEQLGALSSAAGAAIAAATIAPLHHRVTRWAERRFQSNLVHLRHGLPLLVGDLRETADPVTLADAMLVRVEKGVRAAHGAVVAGGTVLTTRDIGPDAVSDWLTTKGEPPARAGQLVVDRADAMFPMRVPLEADGVGLVGWLLLGPRPDGSFYGKDESETLASIADPVARALAIAIERERRESERQQRDTVSRRTLEAVCHFIHERFGVDVSGSAAIGWNGSQVAVVAGQPPEGEPSLLQSQ